MKISNYSNYNQNFNYKNKTSLKMLDNYYFGKKGIRMSPENRKNKIKPPFKQGLYSYKQSFNTLQSNYNKNLLNNKLFIDDSPIFSNNKHQKENNILNINNIAPQSQISKNNSSLCFSSINLNKYKINTSSNQGHKKIIFNNNINNSTGNNLNNVKNTNISLNININNLHPDNKISNSKKVYQNNFGDNPKNEKESRRMIIEYIKVLNNISNNKEIKQTFVDNNISLKVLNQKYNDTDFNYYNNHELFGEAKKQLYLKNLNYSLSYDSYRSNNNEENNNIQNNNTTSNILDVNNISNLLVFNNDKKKTNFMNFLCVPRVLNVIEDGNPKKCIFLITLDETNYTEGKESYLVQWRDMNNEIENEFNVKDIKGCEMSKRHNNRFIIIIEKEEMIENLKFEVETPSKEICNNYILGINNLI